MAIRVPNPCYEVEIRGPLQSERAQRALEAALAGVGAEVGNERLRRESYIFEVNDGSLDLRLRKAEAGPELVLKSGPERLAVARWKHTVGLRSDLELKELQAFVAAYGYVKGHIIRRYYTTYTWAPNNPAYSFKIVVAEVPGWPQYNYFEIERAIVDEEMISHAIEQVNEVAARLNLACWSRDEYLAYLANLNKDEVDAPYEWKGGSPWSRIAPSNQFPMLPLGLGGGPSGAAANPTPVADV